MAKSGGIPIGGRIALLLVCAVLPLAAVGAAYAWVAGETARQADLRARYETARVVAGTVESLVESAATATEITLSDGALGSEPSCSQRLDRLLAVVPGIADVSLVVGGRRICGRSRLAEQTTRPLASGIAVLEPRADTAVALGADGLPSIRIVRIGDAGGGEPMMAVVHIELAPIWSRLAGSIAGLGNARVYVLTETGGVIADPDGVVDTRKISAVIAAVAAAGEGAIPVVQVDASGGGFVSIARVGASRLRVAVASDADLVSQSLPMRLALVAGIPFLFLVAAVGIAWFGVERLVNRWVRRLGRAASRYGEGDLTARVGDMDGAPQEFHALGARFDAMASRMEARSIDLERALAEKDHFVRELHHRVKNNFQMIASLLTLQRREAGVQNEAAIREAHDRVQALAAAYRASYADGETGSVPLNSLVVDLVERLRESAKVPSRALSIDVPREPMSIHLDRGIPFALLLTELLAPMLDSPVVGETPSIQVSTRLDPTDADMIITRIGRLDAPAGPQRPLADRLARAYAAQLGATVTWSGAEVEIRLSRIQ